MTVESEQMIEAFACAGADRFDVLRTTIDKRCRRYLPGRSLQEMRSSIADLVRISAGEGTNLIIRPHADAVGALIQLDDLSGRAIEAVRHLSFLLIETSPGRHQAWMTVHDGNRDLARRVKRAAGSDQGANGWVRVAGSRNLKPKYGPEFPTVRIVAVQLHRRVTPADLQAANLVAMTQSPPPTFQAFQLHNSKPGRFPRYDWCLHGAPETPSGEKDRSLADFTWCCTAIRWGWSPEECAGQLMREPLSKAHERNWEYALQTATKAAAAVRSGSRCSTILGTGR